jgi:hypothetical protein
MSTASDRIKVILERGKLRGAKSVDKPELTDAELEQKAEDMKVFFDELSNKVELDIVSYIEVLESGLQPSVEDMEQTITSFNHLRNINDAHRTYIPRKDVESNLEVIRLFMSTHHPDTLLDRLDRAISGEGKKFTQVAS